MKCLLLVDIHYFLYLVYIYATSLHQHACRFDLSTLIFLYLQKLPFKTYSRVAVILLQNFDLGSQGNELDDSSGDIVGLTQTRLQK